MPPTCLWKEIPPLPALTVSPLGRARELNSVPGSGCPIAKHTSEKTTDLGQARLQGKEGAAHRRWGCPPPDPKPESGIPLGQGGKVASCKPRAQGTGNKAWPGPQLSRQGGLVFTMGRKPGGLSELAGGGHTSYRSNRRI